MSYRRKTWVQKRETGKVAVIKKIDRAFADMKAGEKMLIATPGIVDDYIRCIPTGKEATLAQMRKDLAAEWHADCTCPVTSGIFLRIVAEAAHEEWQAGKPLSSITPFWRMIAPGSPTAKKLSFGTSLLEEMRNKEGLGNPAKKKTVSVR